MDSSLYQQHAETSQHHHSALIVRHLSNTKQIVKRISQQLNEMESVLQKLALAVDGIIAETDFEWQNSAYPSKYDQDNKDLFLRKIEVKEDQYREENKV